LLYHRACPSISSALDSFHVADYYGRGMIDVVEHLRHNNCTSSMKNPFRNKVWLSSSGLKIYGVTSCVQDTLTSPKVLLTCSRTARGHYMLIAPVQGIRTAVLNGIFWSLVCRQITSGRTASGTILSFTSCSHGNLAFNSNVHHVHGPKLSFEHPASLCDVVKILRLAFTTVLGTGVANDVVSRTHMS
jgi:hypothetical protein